MATGQHLTQSSVSATSIRDIASSEDILLFDDAKGQWVNCSLPSVLEAEDGADDHNIHVTSNTTLVDSGVKTSLEAEGTSDELDMAEVAGKQARTSRRQLVPGDQEPTVLRQQSSTLGTTTTTTTLCPPHLQKIALPQAQGLVQQSFDQILSGPPSPTLAPALHYLFHRRSLSSSSWLTVTSSAALPAAPPLPPPATTTSLTAATGSYKTVGFSIAMDGISPAELVARLNSDEDGVRKMAVFKLQTAICDPSFADVYSLEGGVLALKRLCLTASGNTLAYGLTSYANLLDIDKGWEEIDQDFVKRVVQLVVQEPLVNILRGAMSILVAIVQHNGTGPEDHQPGQPDTFGFRALRPVTQGYPQFLEMLVQRLSSADHALCANALQLINSLVRDAVTTSPGGEWPRFIKKVQDLGVIRAVYTLMQSTALQDLAQPLLEFQTLTKILLRKWRDVGVDQKRVEHQKAVKAIRDVAARAIELEVNEELFINSKTAASAGKPRRSSSKSETWRRLGFQNDHFEPEFEEVGFLGMMDLADYVRKNEDGFEKMMLEQGIQPTTKRCPISRASIAVTAILYEHFEIDKPDLEDIKEYLALENRASVDRLFKPMLLQWSRLHTAGLQAFLRLWKATGASVTDFGKVSELVRILIDQVVGNAPRTKEIGALEEEIAAYDYQQLRELQMELVELAYEDSWGEHLKQVRDELNHEAMLFIKEQRVRCMLAGSWFPKRADGSADEGSNMQWRFARLSHNRRFLHYADFEHRPASEADPTIDELQEKIDLAQVSSVISNVCASPASPASSTATLQPAGTSGFGSSNGREGPSGPTSRIVINTAVPSSSGSTKPGGQMKNSAGEAGGARQETPLLTLFPAAPTLASEWLDGLLMLLDQTPITDETKRLLSTVGAWGLKIRLLNVSFDDANAYGEGEGGFSPGTADSEGANARSDGAGGPRSPERGVVPSREGLDEDYYYDVFGGA